MRRNLTLVVLLALGVSSTAHAETQVLIDSGRVKLGNVVTKIPARVAGLDLGSAPPPGGSRLFTRTDLEQELRAAGEDPQAFALPAVVRVVRKAKRWAPEELAAFLEPALVEALPAGVALRHVKVGRNLVTPPAVTTGKVTLPRLPRRPGTSPLTAMVELVANGGVLLRVPVQISVDISRDAARASVPRGSRVQLAIEKGPAEVSAAAIALQDLEPGEEGAFRVTATGRVLRARLLSKTLARLSEP